MAPTSAAYTPRVSHAFTALLLSLLIVDGARPATDKKALQNLGDALDFAEEQQQHRQFHHNHQSAEQAARESATAMVQASDPAEESKPADTSEAASTTADANKDEVLNNKEAMEAGVSDKKFEAADSNNDGVLDREEAKAAGVSDDEFEKMDKNKDGVVDKAEWEPFKESFGQLKPMENTIHDVEHDVKGLAVDATAANGKLTQYRGVIRKLEEVLPKISENVNTLDKKLWQELRDEESKRVAAFKKAETEDASVLSGSAVKEVAESPKETQMSDVAKDQEENEFQQAGEAAKKGIDSQLKKDGSEIESDINSGDLTALDTDAQRALGKLEGTEENEVKPDDPVTPVEVTDAAQGMTPDGVKRIEEGTPKKVGEDFKEMEEALEHGNEGAFDRDAEKTTQQMEADGIMKKEEPQAE